MSSTAESSLSWLRYFTVGARFKVAFGTDLNVINEAKSASLLTKPVNGRKAVGQRWRREEPVSRLKSLGAGT